MKKIGIILRQNKSISDKLIYSVSEDLVYFLSKYDVDIKYIILTRNIKENIKEVIECDGIILPGGDIPDINSIELIKYLYENNIPTFGICLGMQEMSIAFDGNIKKMNKYNHLSSNSYVHKVILDKNSRISKILGKETLKVNSRHKDYITYTNINKVGYSDDYILEAVEKPEKKFFIGVQWHPESLCYDNNSIKLFEYFIFIL